MDVFLILLAVFVTGVALGSWSKELFMRTVFREILKDLGVTEQQMRDLAEDRGLELKRLTEELPVVEVRLEQHDNQIYAFRKDNDVFLGQGTDREDLVKRLTENLSNVRVIISKEDGADLIQNG
jgi:division protein CdvB (Snf7/Vps24/ESCRT-III family)